MAETRDQARTAAAELRAKVSDLESQLAPLRAAATALETERASWARERAFLGVGMIDPEAQDVAALVHGRIPEGERPPLDAWLRGLREDPAKAPKALAPYFAPPPAAAPPPPAPGVAPPRAVSVETSAGAGPSVTAEAIKAAAANGLRTNDWTAYRALKAQLETELARK